MSQILGKHKKLGVEGFKKFVMNLETTPMARRKEITEITILEDPVYMQYVLPNILDVTIFFQLTGSEKNEIINTLPAGITSLIHLFSGEHSCEKICEGISEHLTKRFMEELKYIKVDPIIKSSSSNLLLTTLRTLQELKKIKSLNWKLPSETILLGKHIEYPKKGEYLLNYENGNCALAGMVEDKMRVGKWKHFYPTGNLMAIGDYLFDEKEAEWIFYYQNGKMKSSGKFLKNLKEGEWNRYDEQGSLNETLYFTRGKTGS